MTTIEESAGVRKIKTQKQRRWTKITNADAAARGDNI